MRSQQGFQMIMQFLIFPLVFLSGVFFPVDNVPQWLQVIAKVNPLTYGVDAIRQLLLGSPGPSVAMAGMGETSLGVTVIGHKMGILEDTLVIVVLGLLFLLAAAWSFAHQE